MNPNRSTDLHWQAFCYTNDEMSSQQRLEFESRLENDQLACEAVAEAVLLSHALRAATGDLSVVQPRRPKWFQSIGWLAAAAACLALVILSSGWRDAAEPAVAESPPSTEKVAELARAWVASAPHVVVQTPEEEELLALDEEPVLAANSSEVESDVIPAWMLKALSVGQVPPETGDGPEET